MKRWLRFFCLFLCAAFFSFSCAGAEFEFTDERFQGVFTKENLDRIISEYELYDGWYWTTQPYIVQSFHGLEEKPGWTDTAVNVLGLTSFKPGYYGCRWNSNNVLPELPALGYGECYAFASFVGYLLSGEYNPHGHWDRYYSLEASGGLRIGDIVRTEFRGEDGRKYNHSAIVYSDNGKPVKMRAKPSTKCSLYWLVPVGSEVLVDEWGDEWSKITWSDIMGYMMTKFLRPTGGGDLYTVTVPHLTLYQAEALIEQYPGSSKTVERG